MDSPRGRIYLMQGLVDGSISLGDTVVEHFDRCLGCMACVTSCPSGVQYDRLIEQTRAYVDENHRRGRADRLARAALFAVLPHRRRLRAALALRRLPAPGPFAPLKQIAPPWAAPAWPPEHLPGEGPKVALLAGCVASVVFGDVNTATARVLHAEGYDVRVPRAQGCCGALHAHAGRLEEGLRRAHDIGEALAGHDFIVTNAAGRGSHLKDHGGPASRRPADARLPPDRAGGRLDQGPRRRAAARGGPALNRSLSAAAARPTAPHRRRPPGRSRSRRRATARSRPAGAPSRHRR